MKNRIFALTVVFSLLMNSGNLIAKDRRGAEIEVLRRDGQRVRGELIAVKQNTLLLLESWVQTDASVEIDEIKLIKVIGTSQDLKLFTGAGIGLVVCGGAGALIGYYVNRGSDIDIWIQTLEKGAWLGAALGVALGGIIGAYLGRDTTIQIEDRSPQEAKAVLEKLRSKARITNFQ